jgi:hypothetical protein
MNIGNRRRGAWHKRRLHLLQRIDVAGLAMRSFHAMPNPFGSLSHTGRAASFRVWIAAGAVARSRQKTNFYWVR